MIVNFSDLTNLLYLLKTIGICYFSYYTFLKITNDKEYLCIKKFIGYFCIIILSIIMTIIKNKTNSFIGIIFLSFTLSCISSMTTNKNIGYSMTVTLISVALNYSIFAISIVLNFFINSIIRIESDFLNLIIMMIIHIIILASILKIKKLKYGMTFLKNKSQDDHLDIIILGVSVSTLFSTIVFSNKELLLSRSLFLGFIMLLTSMLFTIQKSFKLYYKQKLLEQDLNKTKEELANKNKEIEKLEAENIEISKKAHTLTHKQKSLARKIDEMMMNTEISKEEVAEAKDRLDKIGKQLYKEKNATELTKTEIPLIDDMLKLMQSECIKNKIDFELQVKGNIYYMTNNLITKEDLETLLADHIKNAIIAINHTDNVNRSILVKLGKIGETYGVHIYDSGIEFEKETLENLGKKPSTTHKDEGGTGMGFMNTFDTLRKCKASLLIEEFNKPDKENYTKALIIKFDNKNEFKIKSYRENEIKI